MTDAPKRIWATYCDAYGVNWDEGTFTSIEQSEDGRYAAFLRDDTAIPRTEADALVAAALEDIAEHCESNESRGCGCKPCHGHEERDVTLDGIADFARGRTPADARAALDRMIAEAVDAAEQKYATFVAVECAKRGHVALGQSLAHAIRAGEDTET